MLKSAAITGAASAGLAGGAVAHQEPASPREDPDFYEIAVWIPHDLARRTYEEHGDPWIAQKRAKTYIEGAFARTRHKVEVKTPRILVPNRNHTNFFVDKKSICNHHEYPDYTVDWFDGWLLNVAWLRDWLESDCVPWEPAAHSNIMITDGHNRGGGLAFGSGQYAVAATGRFVARLPPEYQKYGYQSQSDPIQAMWVTLHEIGHNLLMNNIDHDDDGTGHHDTAEIYQREEGNTVTAVGLGGEVTEDGIATNNCGETFDKDLLEGRELTYSDCSQLHFKPGFNGKGEIKGDPNTVDNLVDAHGMPHAAGVDVPEEIEEYLEDND
ncbi:MAG: hypothetical protein ABEJ08_01690 [Halobacteriaceae archaeon]